MYLSYHPVAILDFFKKRPLRHIALLVPDLRAAEQYYQAVFEMEVIGREAVLKDGLWYPLPFDKGWDDAEAAAIEQ